MNDPDFYNRVWREANYRGGSTAQRLIPFLLSRIPEGATINDYGSGTGRAEVELLKYGYKINMVDFASAALEQEAKNLIGDRLTYTVSPLESLPVSFPVALWGICINVLMTVPYEKIPKIMSEMKRTCCNLIIEVYDLPDIRLGVDMTATKGNLIFWMEEMKKYWPNVEGMISAENKRRYIVIGRNR